MTQIRNTALILLAVLLAAGLCAVISDDSDADDDTYTVEVSGETSYGNVTVDPTEYRAGETVTVKVSGSGTLTSLKCVTLTPPQQRVKLVQGEDRDYTFVMPADDVRLTAMFGPHLYRVTVVVDGEGGTASYDGRGYPGGGKVALTVTPDEGMEVKNIQAYFDDGSGNFMVDENPFKPMFDGDLTVHVSFQEKLYNAFPDESITGGKILVAPMTAKLGEKVEIIPFPDEGMKLVSLYYTDEDGASVPIAGLSFRMPASDVTVHAEFAPSVAIGNDEGGHRVTVNGNGQYGELYIEQECWDPGDTVLMKVRLGESCKMTGISARTASGQDLELRDEFSGMNYSFVMPDEDVNVNVSFDAMGYIITVICDEGATVSSDKTDAKQGETVTLSIRCDPGWTFDCLVIENVFHDIDLVFSNSFVMDYGSNVTVEVSLSQVPADIGGAAGELPEKNEPPIMAGAVAILLFAGVAMLLFRRS